MKNLINTMNVVKETIDMLYSENVELARKNIQLLDDRMSKYLSTYNSKDDYIENALQFLYSLEEYLDECMLYKQSKNELLVAC